MSWWDKLRGKRTEEHVFEQQSWQDAARAAVQSEEQLTQVVRKTANNNRLTPTQKQTANDILAVSAQAVQDYKGNARVQAEIALAREKAMAENGWISWEDYYRYEAAERARIAKIGK